MARYFAKLDENNVVVNTIVVDNKQCQDLNGDESEELGISYCKRCFGVNSTWKEFVKIGSFRGGAVSIGMVYMENVQTLGVASTDIFIEPKPYETWSLSTENAEWLSPLGRQPDLTDEQLSQQCYYSWNEDAYQADNTTGWELVTPE